MTNTNKILSAAPSTLTFPLLQHWLQGISDLAPRSISSSFYNLGIPPAVSQFFPFLSACPGSLAEGLLYYVLWWVRGSQLEPSHRTRREESLAPSLRVLEAGVVSGAEKVWL